MVNPWWRTNGATLAALLLVFGVAIFLRLYFVYPAAFPETLYSGGSDSFYWERTLNYSFQTGHQLVQDCQLNAFICLINPRPPLFQWFSLLLGWVLSPAFGGDAWGAIRWVFLLSTALWGALTIFPLYGLIKGAFNRRAGLVAAFLLAISPAHLQRSVASNADHDAFTLFFVVTAYYFFFRSLRTMTQRKWVESWRRPVAIRAGIAAFLRENRETTWYALLSAISLTVVALAWQGWAYAPIILLVYLGVQLLVHRLRSLDTMGLTFVYVLSIGPALLLAAPWYVGFGQVKVWFDVPAYLFGAVLLLAVLFTVTRDLPWSIVIPGVLTTAGAGIAAAALLNPSFANALVSGAGYFVSTKLYETIAEAQPPGLSQVILAFGWPLYFLSWGGIVWMIYEAGAGRRIQAEYLFFVVWAFAAIFMAQAAARFIFNASPAFAASAAYLFTVLVDRFDYRGFKRSFASLSGGGRIGAFRKALKPRHVVGVFIVVLLLLPSTWYGVDASIPFEEKHAYDRQIYDLMPGFLRPPGYDSIVGGQGSFYLGAFGFGLPRPTEAYPAAWRWLASQDTDVSPGERPAYLSWWDYGFEAVDLGEHPTVADNFQNGYHLAGNFLAAQNESESIALLSLRLLESDFYRNGRGRAFSPAVVDALRAARFDDAALLAAFQNPGALIPVVQGDPLRYGYYDTAMQPTNALYIYETNELTSALSLEQLVQLYASLRRATGWSIRYFAVDTRLFPQDAQNTGIFYAPMKLSDRRVAETADGRVIPTDFFRILVNVGGQEKQIQNLLPSDTVQGQPRIEYQPAFYRSMFYRAYIGFSPREAGSFANGIPGFPQPNQAGAAQLAQMTPMQAWNLSHWRAVYKTAYYNPFDDVQNHTTAWMALDYTEALRYQAEIAAGTRTGQVDLSPRTLIQSGVVMLKYYDGAWVNGTVAVDGVVPVPGVRITVQDELKIPHYTTFTDAQGRYSVLVPFGEVSLTASVGNVTGMTLVGATFLNTTTLTISDAQAMRDPSDADGDGRPDWILRRDLVLPGHRASGLVFLDADRDGERSVTTEPVVAGAAVTVDGRALDLSRTVTTSPTGGYVFDHLPSGAYGVTVATSGRTLTLANLQVPTTDVAIDLGLPTTTLTGATGLASGLPAVGATVAIDDEVNGTTLTLRSGSDGRFSFPFALPGNFTLVASLDDLGAPPVRVAAEGASASVNLTLLPSGFVSLVAWLNGNPQPFATFTFHRLSLAATTATSTTDATGSLRIRLAEGTYSIAARVFRPTAQGTELWVFLGTATVTLGATTDVTAILARGVEVTGRAYSKEVTNVTRDASILFTASFGRYLVRSGSLDGSYVAYLPPGTYKVQAVRIDLAFFGSATFSTSTRFDLPMTPATEYSATVFRDLNGNSQPDPGEGVADAEVTFTDGSGNVLTEFTEASGGFRAPLMAGPTYSMDVARSGFALRSFPPADIAALRQRTSIPLVPLNVTVTGIARFGGSPLLSTPLLVHFRAVGAGATSADVALRSSGDYSIDLVPGSYAVSVDENVSPGVDSTRWQLVGDPGLDISVGAPVVSLDLTVVKRHRVSGNVTIGEIRTGGVVRFSGPDQRNVTASGGLYVVYLQPGVYSASAAGLGANATRAFLGTATITGPTVTNFALVPAAFVTGRLLAAGAPLSEVAPIAFTRAQGGVLSATTEETGAYSVYLPPGSYTMSVDHRSSALIDGASRRVRYTVSQALNVTAGDMEMAVDIPLRREFDNVTASGTVRDAGVGVSASIVFAARSGGAMNATGLAAADGTFVVALQPGTYSVYAVNLPGDRVFLGVATFAPGAAARFDVSLGPGFRLGGVTTYRGGSRVSASITFSGTAAVSVTSDAAGVYGVLLPPGAYIVSATATAVENGLPVRYSATAERNITGLAPPLNLELQKELRRAVSLSWDAAQRRTIAGGGSVTYTITVRNEGNTADTFSLIGSPASWVSFPQPSVSLGFGSAEPTTASLDVRVHPPTDALVDHSPITIAATSRDDPSVHGSVTVEVDIVRVRRLGLNTSAPGFDGQFLNLTAVIANRGNDAERVDLALANRAELDSRGWVGRFVVGDTTEVSLRNVSVPANATVPVVVSFRLAGGAPGAQAILMATAVDLQSLSADTTATLSLPILGAEGPITTQGPSLSSDPGAPYQLLVVLATIGVVIGITAALTLRRRRRR